MFITNLHPIITSIYSFMIFYFCFINYDDQYVTTITSILHYYESIAIVVDTTQTEAILVTKSSTDGIATAEQVWDDE